MSAPITLTAFWRYDRWPYVLWGEVAEVRENGDVLVKSYGGWFKPIATLPNPHGRAVAAKLGKLRAERDQEMAAVSQAFSKQALDEAPFLAASFKAARI